MIQGSSNIKNHNIPVKHETDGAFLTTRDFPKVTAVDQKTQNKSCSSELHEAALPPDNLAAGGGSRVSEAQHPVRREDGQRRAHGDQVTLVPRAT